LSAFISGQFPQLIFDARGRSPPVTQGRVSFLRQGNQYSVSSAGLAVMEVEPMPDDLCCHMPQLVWYQPLVSLHQHRDEEDLK